MTGREPGFQLMIVSEPRERWRSNEENRSHHKLPSAGQMLDSKILTKVMLKMNRLWGTPQQTLQQMIKENYDAQTLRFHLAGCERFPLGEIDRKPAIPLLNTDSCIDEIQSS